MMPSKSKSILGALVCSLFFLTALTSCGNSNFFPSQNAIISMTVSPTSNFVAPGSTVAFSATGTLGNNTTEDVTAAVTWSSSSPGVATVSAGTVTGVSLGVATITATANHITVTAPVVVTTMTSFTVSPNSWSPSSSATQQFQAVGNGNAPTITNQVTWTSSDTNCVTITNTGLATYVGSSTSTNCTITATIGTLSDTVNVTGTIL